MTEQIKTEQSILSTDKQGRKFWMFQNGALHREDGPAVEGPNDHKEWWINGKLHRGDGPAIEHSGGSKEWFFNSKRHCASGPAIEWADGVKEWFSNGKIIFFKNFHTQIKSK